MITVDARGLFCPAPVVAARAAIAKLPQEGGRVQILVDNGMAAENLERMAKSMGHTSTLAERGERDYCVTITAGEQAVDSGQKSMDIPLPQSGAGLAVAIGRPHMGGGDEDLGEILMKGFLYALSQLPAPPESLLLFNGGVKLALAGTNTLPDLQVLLQRGTRILVCGTCLNYYEVSHALGAGESSNMFDLVQAMAEARSVIHL